MAAAIHLVDQNSQVVLDRAPMREAPMRDAPMTEPVDQALAYLDGHGLDGPKADLSSPSGGVRRSA